MSAFTWAEGADRAADPSLVSAGLEFVEGADEILDQHIEVRSADPHAHLRSSHVLGLVPAKPAARFPDLIDEVALNFLRRAVSPAVVAKDALMR